MTDRGWVPVWAMPNLAIDTAVEVSHAAVVACTDERLQSYVRLHPAMGSFFKRFHDEFGAQIWPTVTMISEDAPKSVRTVAALGSFRDAICISAIVSAQARTLCWKRSVGLLFADAFDVYPWFPRSDNENRLSAFTPAVAAIHEVKQLRAQPSPALGRRELSTVDCDRVLLNAILTHWENHFVNDIETVEDRRLFRSLEMARAASKMPGGSDATLHDSGRAVALWVSAFEILAHDGHADLGRVLALLSRVDWRSKKMKITDRTVWHKKKSIETNVAGGVYKVLYDARNRFLHGEPVTHETLRVSPCNKQALHFAAPLFRLALTAYLNLTPSKAVPDSIDSPDYTRSISQRIGFYKPQREAEDAMLMADSEPDASIV
jgi:hypothetical protein